MFVKELCDWLASAGHTIEVLCPEPQRGEFQRAHRVTSIRYRVRRTSQRTFFKAGVMENLRRDPNAWPGLLTFPLAASFAVKKASRDWDAVIAHWVLPSSLLLGFVPQHVKRLSDAHSADVRLLERLPMRRAVAQRVAQSPLAFVSQALRDRFDTCLGRASNGLVSPMGVADMAALDRTEARHALGVSGPCFLSLGRLVPIKGVDIAIRALGRRQGTLLVAGEGPERSSLERLARELGADVRFLGVVRGHRKAQAFAAADALVLASREIAGRTEGAPVSLLEAASVGLPIIASRSGGISEVAPPSARLVPIEDVWGLAEATRAIIAMQPRVQRVDHSWRVVGPRLLAALK